MPKHEIDLESKVRFQGVIDDAIEKYEDKLETKGDSWKFLDIFYLRELVEKYYSKWLVESKQNTFHDRKVNAGSAEYDHLKNILNITLMLMARIRNAQIKWAKDNPSK